MSRVDDAAQLFADGKSCSQAVFAAFAPSLGVDTATALKLAAGLGGGMRIGGACGAATGALLVLGLKYSDDDRTEGRTVVTAAVESFQARFLEEIGATDCLTILECDVRSAEGKAMVRERGLRESRCLPAVRAAARIIEEMLESDGRDMAEPTGLLQRGETTIRYWLSGPDDAPLVVLTHGATADHTMFDDLVPALAQRYRVLTWDVPGHGMSQPLPADFGMDRLVQDELGLLDLVGRHKAVLVGQSMGGNLAQEIVFRHPERVEALVLLDCTDNFQKIGAIDRMSLASAGPILALYPFKTLKRQSAEAAADTPLVRERIAAMMDRVADKRSYVEILMRTIDVLHHEPGFRIPRPLLMLLGDHDRLGNIAKAMPVMARREGVPLTIVRDAGHVSNMDRPDVVNAAILSFLDRLDLEAPVGGSS